MTSIMGAASKVMTTVAHRVFEAALVAIDQLPFLKIYAASDLSTY
jgi:hypothetical protein